MQPQQVTDDLGRLLELLPEPVQQALASSASQEELIEVVLDLGRIPEARYPGKVVALGNEYLTRNDLQNTVDLLGQFGADNRAGIERTLHRISAIRNRQQVVVGLTCRVGRAVFGTVAMVRDLLNSGQSLLLMGRPGVGKTTALREIARVLADEIKRRVVVIDTSNEIAGDGDIPHPAIGRARRMQVAKPEYQHQVMIEAVENHMPEVIIIDEIGTELEANAARTIAERGVQLVATAHGNTLKNLIKNPTLCDLIGGIQSVTLGDEEARRRQTQKTVLERSREPTFPVAVEMNSRNHWAIHTDVAATVDLLLRGQTPKPQDRELSSDGSMRIINPMMSKKNISRPKISTSNQPAKPNLNISEKHNSTSHAEDKNYLAAQKLLRIYSCGITKQLLEETIRRHDWPATYVDSLNEADVVMSIKQTLSQHREIRHLARNKRIPILVIKSASLHQIERAIERLLARQPEPMHRPVPTKTENKDKEDALAALEECRLAVEQVVVPLGRPVELIPRNEKILQMQADLVMRYRLRSDVFGHADQQRLRVYPR